MMIHGAPPHPECCLEDHAFQDWLAAQGVLVRYPRRIGTEILQTRSRRHLIPTEEAILELLIANEGYIVPYNVLLAETSLDQPLTPSRVRRYIHRLRKKILYPELILTIERCGRALGVKEFKLVGPHNLCLLSQLWQDGLTSLNKTISSHRLALHLYHSTDTRRMVALRSQLLRSKSALHELGLQLQNLSAEGLPASYQISSD